MTPVAEAVATLGASLFAAWALYIGVVEHPARLAAGPAGLFLAASHGV